MRDSKGIITGEPLKCVWMVAGVVDFKLCGYSFDCENCPFDRAIRGLAASPGEPVGEPSPQGREIGGEQGFRLDAASFYSDSHLWVRVEEGGRVRVGLDDFAQRLTGRIYSIRLPERNSTVAPGKECWSITHGYGETGLGGGFPGTVIQRNERLEQMPSMINSDPYGEGWAFLLEPERLLEGLKTLYYGHRVKEWYSEEICRLRQAMEGQGTDLEITLPDGGLPVKDLSGVVTARIIEMFLSCGRDIRGQEKED